MAGYERVPDRRQRQHGVVGSRKTKPRVWQRLAVGHHRHRNGYPVAGSQHRGTQIRDHDVFQPLRPEDVGETAAPNECCHRSGGERSDKPHANAHAR